MDKLHAVYYHHNVLIQYFTAYVLRTLILYRAFEMERSRILSI